MNNIFTSNENLKQSKSTSISYYSKLTQKTNTPVTVGKLFQLIKTGDGFKQTIQKIRKEQIKAKQDELKKQLPAVTISGTFSENRKTENLLQHSGLIQIDFDNVTDLSNTIIALQKDEFSFAVFISPTAKGIKLIVKIPPDKSTHLACYNQLEKYYKTKFNLIADKQCKDLTRLLFLSWDENIYFNENAIQWQLTQEQQSSLFETVLNKLQQKESFVQGKRNDFIYKLACDCYNAKIEIAETLREIKKHFSSTDFTNDEIERTVNSAYKIKSIAPAEDQKESYSLLKRTELYIQSKYEIRLNEVSSKHEYKLKDADEPFIELNENNIYRDLQHQNINIPLSKLTSLLNSDFVPKFNPFEAYFKSLEKWDEFNEPDYIDKLCEYLPIKDMQRFKLHFTKMLVRCIACALEPSVFNKQVFVLVGEGQNTGKSTFCRWLCPPSLEDYFTEYVNTDKDGLIVLATNFFINMDELATLSKAEINSLKSFISKDKINIRLPFAKRTSVHPRRANFIGSTNNDEFLTDETGSVRWLCFELDGKINFDYNKDIDINNLWKQAYTLYKIGFEYQLTQLEIQENELINKKYLIDTIEQQLIHKYFSPAKKDDGSFYKSSDILNYIVLRNSHIKTNIRTIGKAMKILGFKKQTKYDSEKNFSEYGYYVDEKIK